VNIILTEIVAQAPTATQTQTHRSVFLLLLQMCDMCVCVCVCCETECAQLICDDVCETTLSRTGDGRRQTYALYGVCMCVCVYVCMCVCVYVCVCVLCVCCGRVQTFLSEAVSIVSMV